VKEAPAVEAAVVANMAPGAAETREAMEEGNSVIYLINVTVPFNSTNFPARSSPFIIHTYTAAG
jgi:hypothetical protein